MHEAAAGDTGDVNEIHGTADPAKLREQVIAYVIGWRGHARTYFMFTLITVQV